MKIRTSQDNKQLRKNEKQIEDLCGAISVYPEDIISPVTGYIETAVTVCTVRGISGRKAQFAILSEEGVDELIKELQLAKAAIWH